MCACSLCGHRQAWRCALPIYATAGFDVCLGCAEGFTRQFGNCRLAHLDSERVERGRESELATLKIDNKNLLCALDVSLRRGVIVKLSDFSTDDILRLMLSKPVLYHLCGKFEPLLCTGFFATNSPQLEAVWALTGNYVTAKGTYGGQGRDPGLPGGVNFVPIICPLQF